MAFICTIFVWQFKNKTKKVVYATIYLLQYFLVKKMADKISGFKKHITLSTI